ncbi:MAG: hypothetical protein GIX02_08180 [Candidatus Eremiobacteraeota bacterium]|nr:hypothetical protein [Candidatus Eremiobacteraeota bacterium]
MPEERDERESFCSQLWDALFDAVDACRCLTSTEKRVLQCLWAQGTVGTWVCESYPGHDPFAKKMRLSQQRLESTLRNLEKKGFIKPTQRDQGGPRFLLNALLVEDAYERTKREHPGLFRL